MKDKTALQLLLRHYRKEFYKTNDRFLEVKIHRIETLLTESYKNPVQQVLFY